MKQVPILSLLIASSMSPLMTFAGGEIPTVDTVAGQPLAANATRLLTAFRFLGAPLPDEDAIQAAIDTQDPEKLQTVLDSHVLCAVSLNPEVRVKAVRGPVKATLQQGGFTPFVVKVVNHSTVTRRLRILSPQAGPVYAGAALNILKRQAQTELKENENSDRGDRFLEVEMFRSPPMTDQLSGLEVEYLIALIYCSEAGRREATLEFDVGAGTQDIGFRGEVPVLFDVRPAIPVELSIRDHDGLPTAARLTFRDSAGRVYPPQVKRLAPDLFFQPQVYRHDGEVVLLPPGELELVSTRGPEYVTSKQTVLVPARADDGRPHNVTIQLRRWIDPSEYGYYCGDHHIHGAGCSHYDNPTEGVTPADMFRQVKGEGLHVGCVLTWGPCFDFQRRFFSPQADDVSEPLTLLKYDLEISGFGSAALGHVCLLNLRDQTFPGSDGRKDLGWPTWTVPVMRWAKEQGGVTGYPHSAMLVDAEAAAKRMVAKHDANNDGRLSPNETQTALLPRPFATIDEDQNGFLSERELRLTLDTVADELPNLAVPEMNGGGALEICVSTAEGVCDFTSAMNTARVSELNTWYHLLNCGFPLKLSGETDFPCMSGRRVGQGRVYVQLGQVDALDFGDWCEGIAAGRSYVSDGFAHAIDFTVGGQAVGDEVQLAKSDVVTVRCNVGFAAEIPRAVAYGTLLPARGRRWVGDTVNLHASRSDEMVIGGERLVEVVVNGESVAETHVPADGQLHALEFSIPVRKSSWVALRHFPQLHTNPVNVIVVGKPIRSSHNSARWCAETIRQLWDARHERISAQERTAARETYDRAIARYEQIASEATK